MSRITGPRYNLHPSTEAHVQAGILVSTRGALAASGFTSPILGIVISHRQGGSTIQSSLIHTAGDHSATTLAPFFPADEVYKAPGTAKALNTPSTGSTLAQSSGMLYKDG